MEEKFEELDLEKLGTDIDKESVQKENANSLRELNERFGPDMLLVDKGNGENCKGIDMVVEAHMDLDLEEDIHGDTDMNTDYCMGNYPSNSISNYDSL